MKIMGQHRLLYLMGIAVTFGIGGLIGHQPINANAAGYQVVKTTKVKSTAYHQRAQFSIFIIQRNYML